MDAAAVERFRAARRDPTLAVLEGFHTLKHALRFGAQIQEIATSDPERIRALARALAPDVVAALDALEPVPRELFEQLAPRPPYEPVIALAARASWTVAALEAGGAAPVVFLEEPRDPGNIGAVVRVAAAAGPFISILPRISAIVLRA